MNPSRLKHLLSQVRDREAAMEVWSQFHTQLDGYTFVLAERNGPDSAYFPSRIDFPGGGQLRSVFAHNHIFLINNQVMNAANNQGKTRTLVVSSVAFDANVASYLHAWHQGRQVPVVEMVKAVVRALNGGTFNFDLLPFLLERSEDIVAQRDLQPIYETVFATEWFRARDRTRFEQTGEIRPMVQQHKLASQAQVILAGWHRHLQQGMFNLIRERHMVCYAYVLKLALIQLEHPSPADTALKLKRWLEFMHNELQLLLIFPTRVAVEFFQKGGAYSPMSKVAARSLRLCDHARNVAWDFMQLIWRHTFTGLQAPTKGFLIPYMLTFDRGLAGLYDLYAQRSCLFGNEIHPPQFFAEMDLPALITEPYPELEPIVSSIFNTGADAERSKRRQHCPTNIPALISQLEAAAQKFSARTPTA